MDAFDAAEFALSELMPQKSRNIYMSQYERFMKWCSDKNVSKYTESVFLSYFYEESKRVTCSTLWSYYSMLKSTMAINKDVDISKFHKLTAFLKRKNDGYRPKKAKILYLILLNLNRILSAMGPSIGRLGNYGLEKLNVVSFGKIGYCINLDLNIEN